MIKIDQFIEKMSQIHGPHINCKQGCFNCCLSGLTVTLLEAQIIDQFISDNKLILPSSPHHPGHCLNLGPSGDCLIYPVRPIVCRTHGMPIDYKNEASQKIRSICPQNFIDIDLSILSPNDVINGDTINLILGSINIKYLGDIKRVSLEEIGRFDPFT